MKQIILSLIILLAINITIAQTTVSNASTLQKVLKIEDGVLKDYASLKEYLQMRKQCNQRCQHP